VCERERKGVSESERRVCAPTRGASTQVREGVHRGAAVHDRVGEDGGLVRHRVARLDRRLDNAGRRVRNVQRFRGGLVFKAHRLLYHSTLGLRVIKKREDLDVVEEEHVGLVVAEEELEVDPDRRLARQDLLQLGNLFRCREAESEREREKRDRERQRERARERG